MRSQEPCEPTRFHSVDVDSPTGEQDGDLLTHPDGVAWAGHLEALLQRQDQIVSRVEPWGMQRSAQIFNPGNAHLGP
jgi:hypothetical protein